jgi:hypothetical protein
MLAVLRVRVDSKRSELLLSTLLLGDQDNK